MGKKEIKRVINTFNEGGLMLGTTHYIKYHGTVDELAELFDYAYKTIRA